MKHLITLLCVLSVLCVSNSAFAATPIVDAKFSGANNQVLSGATFTIKSGATFVIEGGGTFSGAQAADATLTAFAGLSNGANKLPYFTGTDAMAVLDFTSFSQSLLPLSTSSAWRTAIFPSSPSTGDIIQWNGSSWVKISLGSFSTGLLKVTIATGALGTAVAATDYVAPGAINSSGLTIPSASLVGRSTASTGPTETISMGDNMLLDSGLLHSTALFRSRLPKTSGYTVVAGDKGRLIDCTSGTFTLAFDPAATLGDGFFVGIYNSGSGTITLNPDSSETIRDTVSAATTKTLAQGTGVVLLCDGVGFLVTAEAKVTPTGTVGTHTIYIPAGAMQPSTTAGCSQLAIVEISAGQPDLASLDFGPSTDSFAQFSVAMPKSWNHGTVNVEFIWSHASTSTNFAVVWGAQAVAVSNDDALGTSYGTAQTVTDTGGTTNDLYITSATSAITIAGTPATGDVVFFRVYRDADAGGDTLAIDARLLGVRVLYNTSAETDD